MLSRKNWESFRRPHKVPVEFWGMQSHGLHSISPMIEMLSGLGGGGGVKTTDEAPVLVSSSR